MAELKAVVSIQNVLEAELYKPISLLRVLRLACQQLDTPSAISFISKLNSFELWLQELTRGESKQYCFIESSLTQLSLILEAVTAERVVYSKQFGEDITNVLCEVESSVKQILTNVKNSKLIAA
ncbi:hypothetical protein KO525_18645 [Psychrosphaera sp. B3R10]|uniref:hypothetical protein n=1 Tax=unclassified Psychrosphaera TaxID=2641570 RepID=UPI001C082399|nr:MULTISPECIES: hypothetical protein [unclassified Psychrosphaera]MBU2883008.1 hypothetical protein [Psychrosphaera sp. I2R16]MBU2991405.1 hypothetical protein [Psychrosphaera sp. B3R10]